MVKNKNEKYLRINIIVIKAERIYSKNRKIERYLVARKIYR
jgi:hypothetical protein